MIKRIKIRDFKSIRELDLKLEPVTVLVGRSGSGKSNIVQAIRFLRNILLNYGQAINYELGWQRIVPAGEKHPKTSLDVVFSLPGEDHEYTYSVGFGTPHNQNFGNQLNLMSELLALGGEVVFSRVCSAGNNAWSWDKLPNVAVTPQFQPVPMLGSFPSLQKVVFAFAALSSGIGYYHFPSTTLTNRVSPQHGDDFLRTIQGLSDNAANYLAIIAGITQDFHHPNLRKNLLASAKSVNPSIVSIELNSLLGPERAVVGHDAAGQIIELNLEQESDGFRRFYAHLLALYQAQSKLTIIFEEPENALFPGALSLLADEFKAAPNEKRGQVIATTHSPIFLDSFDVDEIRVVEMRDGETFAGPVSKEQREAVKNHLLTTGELLTTEKAKLEITSKAA